MRVKTALLALAVLTAPVANPVAVAATAEEPETNPDERMIIASDTVVLTFEGVSVRILGTERTARVNAYLAKPDNIGAIRYRIDIEADCRRNQQKEVASEATKPDGSPATLALEPGDRDFKPVRKDGFEEVIQQHLCAIKDATYSKGGVYLYAPGEMAAHSVFALLALGIDNKPAAELASYIYTDSYLLNSTLDAQKVAPERRAAVIKALDPQIAPEAKPPPPIIPLAAAVASGHVGRYVHSEMELGAGLWLKADGTFQYGLTVGSLDETARGRWTARGNRITLANDRPPVPPAITAGEAKRDASTTLRLTVTTGSGRGVPGVDLVVGLAGGKTVEGYTQVEGWDLPAGTTGEPRWVMFSMPSYGLHSARFPIDRAAGNALTFVLAPNDIGVVDMAALTVTADPEGLTVIREGQPMHFDRRPD